MTSTIDKNNVQPISLSVYQQDEVSNITMFVDPNAAKIKYHLLKNILCQHKRSLLNNKRKY